MKKNLLFVCSMLFTVAAMAQKSIEFTFNRSTNEVLVEGADGVTATIAATSASNAWNTGGAMASRNDVLCQNTNTSATSAGSPITFTLTIRDLDAADVYESVAYTHVAVNGAGNLQPSNNVDVRHCNYILGVNGENVAAKDNVNIWIPAGATEKTETFEGQEIRANADGSLTLKLTLYKGTTNDGCFYGLTKITLVEAEAVAEPEEEKAFYHLSGRNFTAEELESATTPLYISIKGLAASNHDYWNYESGAENTSKQYYDQSAIFVWEPVAGGIGHYLKKLGAGYMQKTSPGDYAETTENAAIFEAVKPVQVNSGANGKEQFNKDSKSDEYFGEAGGADYLVRFVTTNNDGKWLNLGDVRTGTQAPAFNKGYGTFTLYQICALKGFDEAVNVTIKNTGNVDYATFYFDAPLVMPEGVTAYSINTIESGSVTLDEVPNGIVPANTGVVLAANVDEDTEFEIDINGSAVAAIEANKLRGTTTDTYVEGDAYVLANGTEGVGLYLAEMTDGAWLNNANKAYLPAPADAEGVKSYSFRWENGTTGVENVKVENASNVIYDLTGRRVEAITTPGIYIVNGVKRVVR